jgi:hypothetical protein
MPGHRRKIIAQNANLFRIRRSGCSGAATASPATARDDLERMEPVIVLADKEAAD